MKQAFCLLNSWSSFLPHLKKKKQNTTRMTIPINLQQTEEKERMFYSFALKALLHSFDSWCYCFSFFFRYAIFKRYLSSPQQEQQQMTDLFTLRYFL